MSQAANSTLSVAITSDRTGFLSQYESERLRTAIQNRIMSEAKAKQGKSRPTFHAQPRFEDGVLKLWCDNDFTLDWLKKTVLFITGSFNIPIVVKSQCEIQKRAPCKFEIPDVPNLFYSCTDIVCALAYQNPMLEFERWEFLSAKKESYKKAWNVSVTVPEDQIRVLMNTGHLRLSIGLGAVDVEFENGFYFDTKTQKICGY